MKIIRIVLLLCELFATVALGSQQPPYPKLAFSLSRSEIKGEFHVALRNTRSAPIHVLLGYGDGSGHDGLDSVSFRLTSANGKVFEMVPIGFPIIGIIRILNAVIPPHQEWTADLSLKDFMGDERGKPLINPMLVDMLPAGDYQLQAVFKGERISWPPRTLLYWTGTLLSNSIDYKVP